MKKFIRNVNGVAADETMVDNGSEIFDRFHPDVAKQFIEVAISVEAGATLINGDRINPSPPPSSDVATPPTVGVIRFKLLFKIVELVAVYELAKTDSVIKTFMAIVDDPRTDVVDLSLSAIQDGIEYVLSKIYSEPGQEALLEDRLMEILSGHIG